MKRVLLLSFALLAPATGNAREPEGADDRESLSLSEVMDDVARGSPVLAGERAQAEAQAIRADAAGAWSDPFVAAGPDEYAFNEHAPMLRVEVSQAIPLPGKLSPRIAGARAEARAAAAGIEVTTRSLRVAAIQLFLRGVYLEHAQAALDEQRLLLGDVIAASRARYAAGVGEHRDVLVASAEKASLDQSALVQERERMMIVARLDELRGHPPRPRIVRFVDDRVDMNAALPAELDEALATQPELLSGVAALDAADARAEEARASALPDLIVQGMWMQSFRADEHSTAGAMVGVSVPLFYWWKQAPAAEAALREKKGLDAEQQRLRLALAAEWEEASLALRSAKENADLYQASVVPATDAALQSTKAAYAAQTATFAELLSLMRTSTAVRLEMAAAELDVRLAEARLRNLLASPTLMALAPQSPLSLPSSGALRRPSAGRRGGAQMPDASRASPPPGSMMMREMGGM